MTIKEIAKLAGVSNAAVSRYLNGGSLSAEKHDRIQKVVEENKYVPSAYARVMRTKKSNQIGVIVPKINSESVPRIVSGISEVLNEESYKFVLADTNNNVKRELEYLEIFQNSQLAGVIFIATILTKKHMELLKQMNIPVVIIGQHLSGYSCVSYNDFHAAYDLAKVLLNHCKGAMGMICVTDKDKAAGAARKQGVLEALKDAGKSEKDLITVLSQFTIESGFESMKQLLEKAPSIDTVFCATDNIAVGAMLYLREIGKKIPEEIRLTGIGNNQVAQIISPSLTTAKYYYKTSGIEAAKILLDLIKDNNQPVKHMQLGYEIIKRQTTLE
ncbi:MAG: LacI family DNA-binding transcriptional regulator [Clostridiales bacterium]|nr:LacI family DNA-binding transcriptional regulator [Clostridiales bacterium]